jgi:predicted flap endonuclease-1-like 5' DNA nuclease
MWALVGGAALLALLIGWGLRGALLKGRMRRALVEAGVAKTELEQARTEIEGLYVAQRKLTAAATVPAVDMSADHEAALLERDGQITALSGQVNDLTAEIERVRADAEAAIAAAESAAAEADRGEAAPAGEATPADTTNLEWRNRYLESRVRTLEEQLTNTQKAMVAPSGDAAVETDEADASENVELAKLRWQNDYLRTRLRVFEERAGEQLSGDPPESPEDLLGEDDEIIDADEEDDVDDDARETPDEELARLRWRNRYLEGRLAYLEEERSREAAEAPSVTPPASFTGGLASARASVAPHLERDIPSVMDDLGGDDPVSAPSVTGDPFAVTSIRDVASEDAAPDMEDDEDDPYAEEDSDSEESGGWFKPNAVRTAELEEVEDPEEVEAQDEFTDLEEARDQDVEHSESEAEPEADDVQSEPELDVETEAEAEPEPEADPEPEPALAVEEPEPEAELELAPEPDDQTALETDPLPEVEPESDPEPEPTLETETAPEDEAPAEDESAEDVEHVEAEAAEDETIETPAELETESDDPDSEPEPAEEISVDPYAEPAEEPALASAQPAGLDSPREGTPDDLTQIDGIGPRIQDVLNSLGIYHYDQISGWTEANEAWVDEYLSFSGRVSREGWVRQARSFSNVN